MSRLRINGMLNFLTKRPGPCCRHARSATLKNLAVPEFSNPTSDGRIPVQICVDGVKFNLALYQN